LISTKPVDSVSPTLVKQYSYCPVIVWLKAWFLLEEPVTDSMRIGKESVKPPGGKGQVIVRAGCGTAILDEVVRERDGSLTMVEKKAYKSYNYSRYVEQAVASYIIAKEVLPGVRRLRIEVEGVGRTLELNWDLVKEVEEITKKTQEIVSKEANPPRPWNSTKCRSCWYGKFCPHQ